MSVVGSTLVFILSMLDLGYASLWTSPVISPLTIIYHIVTLVLQANDNRSRANASARYDIYPTAKVGSVVIAYLLACAWLVPMLMLIFMGGLWDYFIDNSTFQVANKTTVSIQLTFTVVEWLLMLTIAAVSTRMRVLLKRWAMRQCTSSCIQPSGLDSFKTNHSIVAVPDCPPMDSESIAMDDRKPSLNPKLSTPDS